MGFAASPPSTGAVESPRALRGVGHGLMACARRAEFCRDCDSVSGRRAEFCRELDTDSASSLRDIEEGTEACDEAGVLCASLDCGLLSCADR